MRRFRWHVEEIEDTPSAGPQANMMTQGEGDEKATAAVLRSVADQIDPPRKAMRETV